MRADSRGRGRGPHVCMQDLIEGSINLEDVCIQHTCIYIYRDIHIRYHIYIYTYTHMYVYIYIYVYIHICIHVHVYLCLCAYV